MRRLAIAAGIAVAVGALAGCQRSVATDPWAGAVGPDVLARMGLEYYWRSVQLPIDREGGETLCRLWQLDENLYALSSRNRLFAVNAVNGRLKWYYPVAPPALKVFDPCHAKDVIPDPEAAKQVLSGAIRGPELKLVDAVIVNTLSTALVLDRTTGKPVRKLDLPFAANSPGASDGDFLFLGSVKGWYHAVRLCDGLVQWTRSTGEMISAAPISHGGRLAVASHDGRFYVIKPGQTTQRRLWVQPTDGPLSAAFVVDDRGCFVPSQDYKLYAFDAVSGEELWTPFRTQGPLRRAVQLGQRSAFQYAENDRFYAIDVGSGRKRWEMPDGRLVLGASDQHVFVLTSKNRLRKVHESLGRTEVTVPLNGLDLFVPNAANDAMYAGTADGRLVCLRPLDAETLTVDVLSK